MGVVYRAMQLALDRQVALKLLTPELAEDDAFRERFQRESRLLAATDHPNVITIYEAGEHDGRLFIAMRYVPGTDLRALLRNDGKLGLGRGTALLAQVADALDAAHGRGLIHRDVKPANILIEKRDGGEHAYLTDFGLTKSVGSEGGGLTATGQFVGTVDFIAPEQVMGQPVDARADVYALGCVLFSMLTGSVPFERDSDVAKIFAHVNDPCPSLLEALPEAPAELDAVVRRALEKDPDDRFPSAGDLGRAAVAAVEGQAPDTEERTVAAGDAAPVSPEAREEAQATRRAGASRPADPTRPATRRADAPGPAHAPGPPGAAPPATPLPTPAAPARRRNLRVVGLALAAAVAIAAAAALLLGGGSSEDGGDALNAALRPQSIPVIGTPVYLAVGEGATWVVSVGTGQNNGTVTPIDADGKKGKQIPVGRAPTAIAVGGGVAFVIVKEGTGIARVDTSERRLLSTAPVEVSSGSDLVFADASLWAVTDDNEIARIDVKTGRVIETIPAPGEALTGQLAVGGGAVWVGADSNAVFRIDLGAREVAATVSLPGGSYPEALAFGNGALWIADSGRNRLVRVDPATNRVVKEARVDGGVSGNDLVVESGAIWQANLDPATLRRFDPSSGTPARNTPTETNETSELAVGLGSAWLTLPDTDVVTRFGY